MLPEKLVNTLKKQHYRIVGNHSGVQICNWTKNSLIDKGTCYKEKFYGIKSHLCCEMSPSVGFCQNKCIHCWRAIELTVDSKMNGKTDEPDFIISGLISARQKLINGFKGNKKVNMEKFKEAQEPKHFAISLTGEPTLYPKIGELISELRKRGKTSFLVTNGLNPEVLKELSEKKKLPTQLYLSLNSPNIELYLKWHKSSVKDAWEKLNETLDLFPKLKTRKVIRMTLVKDLNSDEKYIKEYTELIKKAKPDFIEVKSFMSVGYSRRRLGYDKMISHEEIKEYSKILAEALSKESYKILDEHEPSRVVLIGKDKSQMKIKPEEV